MAKSIKLDSQTAGPVFDKQELWKLQSALGKTLRLFPCNESKQPIVSYSDPHNFSTFEDLEKAGFPSCVYAVPAKSNELLFVDIDTEDKRKQELIMKMLPDTFTVKSGREGGGFHLYYWSIEKVPNFVDQGKKIGFDLKTANGDAGGYVIAPGSWHTKGQAHYRVIKDVKIVSVTKKKLEDVADYLSKVMFEDEGRNAALYKHLVQRRTRDGFDDQMIETEAVDYNQRYFLPPLPDKEVETLIGSILKEEPMVRGASANEVSVYKDYVAEHPGLLQFRGSFYKYNGTHWEHKKKSDIFVDVQKYIVDERKDLGTRKGKQSTLVNDVVSLIARHSDLELADDPFSNVSELPRYVNFQNGVMTFPAFSGAKPTWLDRDPLSEKEIMRMYISHCLPYEFDPKQTQSPVFDSYIHSFVKQLGIPQKNHDQGVQFLLELMAYGIVPTKPKPYFLLITGKEGTGKSSFPRIMFEIVGPTGYVKRELKDMVSGRFAKAALLGKLLYVDDDLPDNTTIPGDFLKQTAGEMVTTVERKNESEFQARFSVFPILLSNTVPNNTGAEGVRRRAIMMEVKTRFEGNDDPFLVDKLAGRVKGHMDERPAIFNKLKDAWERLSTRDFVFDVPAVVKQTTDNWITSGDNVSAFLKDASEIQGENEITINDEWQWIPTNTVYEMYSIWAERSGVGKLSKNNLTSRIKSIGHASDVKKLNGKAHRCVYLNLLIDKNRDVY